MRIKRFIAPDMRTALRMVRDEHGPDAVILSNRPVHGGIEVVAATDYDEALVQQALRTAAEPAATATPPARPSPVVESVEGFVPSSIPARVLEPEMATADSGRVSRADAMIAALSGNASPARSAVAERAREVARQDAESSRTPALASFLRAAPAAEAAPAPPVQTGDDFRALLARLNDAEEPAVSLGTQAARNVEADVIIDEPTPAIAEIPADIVSAADFLAAAVEVAAPVAEAPAAPQPMPAPIEPAPAPVAVAVVAPAVELAAPTFAEFINAVPAPAIPAPQPTFDAFDALAEMAAAQIPAPAPVAPPSLQVVASQSDDPTIAAMRNELTSMRQMIERQMGQFAVERLRGSPARAFAFETLQAYGVDEALAQTIAGRIDPRLEPAKVRAPLLAELARTLTIARAEPIEDGGVFALIGPTGAGKTTTLAKLAARFAQRHRARDVALVTTDVERPGAREQLHALGRKLGITVCEAEGPEGLTNTLDQLVDYPLVLVDTAGYAARDKAQLSQVTWLRATRGLRSLLVLPANLQSQDLSEAVRRYRMAAPEAVVLTKLDETSRLGSALSVAVKHGLPLAYTTAGQQVPADLEAADASRLVLQLEKLRRAAENPLATEDRHVVA